MCDLQKSFLTVKKRKTSVLIKLNITFFIMFFKSYVITSRRYSTKKEHLCAEIIKIVEKRC